jgi:hypothetical protein
VDEFWVCQHCRSLNRAGTGKCYSCRNKYGSKPKEAGSLGKSAAAPAPSTAASIADFRSAPPPPSPAPAPFTRPVALGAVPAPYAAPVGAARGPMAAAHGTALGAYRRPSPVLNPIAALRGRIAGSLAMRQSVSVAWLGYVTAALLVVVLALGAILAITVMPVATYLLAHANAGDAWAQLSAGRQGSLASLSIAFAAAAALALLCFSVFLGLTTHNATGLGADQPMLTPYGAGLCWAGAIWAQVRITVGLVVPAALIWRGYVIPGLVAAIVAVEIAQRHLEDAGGWLSRPYRHLPDLYAKLGIEGSISSPIAWIWSGCFRIANAMVIAVACIPMLGVALVGASTLSGRSDVIGWQSTGLGAAQITVALLVASLLGWTAISVALLVPITLGLVRRQRTRKTLVRVGRARSWVARPGQGQYAGPPNALGNYDGYDEDRIVERVPGAGSGPEGPGAGGAAFEMPGSPGPGGPGFGRAGGPGPGGPTFGQVGGPGFGDPSPRLPADDRPAYEMPGLDGFGGPGSRGPGSGGSSGGDLG